MFREELDAIAARKGARVIYFIGASDEPENLLNAYMLRAMVGRYGITTSSVAPPRMAARLRESLLHNGHNRRQLHEEQFTFCACSGLRRALPGFDRLSPRVARSRADRRGAPSSPITTSARPTGSALGDVQRAGRVVPQLVHLLHRLRTAEQGGDPAPGPG